MRAPLAASYPTKVALVLLALCPYIVVTTAGTLLERLLAGDDRALESPPLVAELR